MRPIAAMSVGRLSIGWVFQNKLVCVAEQLTSPEVPAGMDTASRVTTTNVELGIIESWNLRKSTPSKKCWWLSDSHGQSEFAWPTDRSQLNITKRFIVFLRVGSRVPMDAWVASAWFNRFRLTRYPSFVLPLTLVPMNKVSLKDKWKPPPPARCHILKGPASPEGPVVSRQH